MKIQHQDDKDVKHDLEIEGAIAIWLNGVKLYPLKTGVVVVVDEQLTIEPRGHNLMYISEKKI